MGTVPIDRAHLLDVSDISLRSILDRPVLAHIFRGLARDDGPAAFNSGFVASPPPGEDAQGWGGSMSDSARWP